MPHCRHEVIPPDTLDDIAVATRFYDRLMAEDPELKQITRIVQRTVEGWQPIQEFKMHYEPSMAAF